MLKKSSVNEISLGGATPLVLHFTIENATLKKISKHNASCSIVSIPQAYFRNWEIIFEKLRTTLKKLSQMPSSMLFSHIYFRSGGIGVFPKKYSYYNYAYTQKSVMKHTQPLINNIFNYMTFNGIELNTKFDESPVRGGEKTNLIYYIY